MEIKENNNDINSEEKKLDFNNECLIDLSKKDEGSLNNEEKMITLFFNMEKGGKGMYIDTNYNNTFSNMIKDLQTRYELEEEIDENKLFFNGINIDPSKSPKDYNIRNESHLLIKN